MPCNVVAGNGCPSWAARFKDPGTSTELADAGAVVSPGGDAVYVAGDANRIVSGSWTTDALAVKYNAATGAKLWDRYYNGPPLTGSSVQPVDMAHGLSLSPDGSRLFLAGGTMTGSPPFGQPDFLALALDAATGTVSWAATYDGPSSVDDTAEDLAVNPVTSMVYLAGDSGSEYAVVAFDAATGNQAWAARFSARPTPWGLNPQVLAVSPDGNTVYVARAGLGAVALDAATGAQRWQASTTSTATLRTTHLTLSPSGNRVFAAGEFYEPSTKDTDYGLAAYSPTGELQWVSRWSATFADSPGSVSIDHGLAATADHSGALVFVSGTSGPAPSGSTVQPYQNPTTVAFLAATGATVWVARDESTYVTGASNIELSHHAMVAANRCLYVGTTIYREGSLDLLVAAYHPLTGTELWTSEYGQPGVTEELFGLAANPDATRIYAAGRLHDSDWDTLTVALGEGNTISCGQAHDARMAIPWGEANDLLSYAPQEPAPAYLTSQSAPALGIEAPPGKDIAFRFDALRFGQYTNVSKPTVPLYLDFTARFLAAEAFAATQAVAHLEVRDRTGQWVKVSDLRVQPKEGVPPTGWTFVDRWVEVPTALLSDRFNDFRIRIPDPVPNAPFLVVDGTLHAAMLTLVAPPVVILHGWTYDEERGWKWYADTLRNPSGCDKRYNDPATVRGAEVWQCDAADTLLDWARAAFGQNPWQWSKRDGGGRDGIEAVRPYGYNPKRGAEAVAADLDAALGVVFQRLQWKGKPDLLAHSYGGLVARQYATSGVGLRADTIVTLATPHLGSRLADWYTCNGEALFGYDMNEPADYYHDARLQRGTENPDGTRANSLFDPAHQRQGDVCHWKDYYDPSPFLGAFKFRYRVLGEDTDAIPPGDHDELLAGAAFDHLADFQIKVNDTAPGVPNRFLESLNARFLALSPAERGRHVAVAGICSLHQDGSDANCPEGTLVPNWLSNLFADSKIGNLTHDLVVPKSSALNRGSQMAGFECVGPEYWHVGITGQRDPRLVALQAFSGAWANPTLLQGIQGCRQATSLGE